MENTLLHLAGVFGREGVSWVLAGSASLALQGIALQPQDIDIMTGREEALACNDTFQMCLLNPIAFRESEQMRSFFGVLLINGVKVEIMGGLQVKSGSGWVDVTDASFSRVNVHWNGLQVPTYALYDQARIYTRLGRPKDLEKVRLIRQHLRETDQPGSGV